MQVDVAHVHREQAGSSCVFSEMPGQEAVEAGGKRVDVRGGCEQHIGVEIAVRPVCQRIRAVKCRHHVHADEHVAAHVSIVGQVGNHAGHREQYLVVDLEGLSQHIRGIEKLARDGFRQHDTVGLCQCRERIALQPLEIEHGQQRRIGEADVVFDINSLSGVYPPEAGKQQARRLLHFRKILQQQGRHLRRIRGQAPTRFAAWRENVPRDPEQPVGVRVVIVITRFLAHEESDQQKCGQAQGQASDADA